MSNEELLTKIEELENDISAKDARIELLEDQLRGERDRAIEGMAEQCKAADDSMSKANACGRLLLQGMKALEAYKDKFPNEDVGGIDYSDFKSKVYDLVHDLDVSEAVDAGQN